MLDDNATFFFTGAYIPLTTNGKIIVDEMLTSSYADIDHDLFHIMGTPMQTFTEVIEWIFGTDFGFPVYAVTAIQLGLARRTIFKLLTL